MRDSSNRAMRALRLAKIRSLRRGVEHYTYTIFLDVDTLVCASLLEAVCAASPRVALWALVESEEEYGPC